MSELLTKAPCRQDWKRISAKSSTVSSQWPNQSRDWSEMKWTEHHHKLNCERIGLLCSRLKSQHRFKLWMNVHLDIFCTAEPFVTMGWLCIIMGQGVMQKVWFAIFKVKVTLKAHIIKYDFQRYLLKPNWMAYIIMSWSALLKIALLCSMSRSQWRFKISLNLFYPFFFFTTDLLATRLDVFVYFY